MKKLFLFMSLCCIIFNGYSQVMPARYQAARGFYNRLAYSEAIPLLIEECIGNKNRFLEADIMLADCYNKTNQYKLAEGEYAIVCQDKRLKDNKQKLYYAQILQTNQKYDLAATWYKNYLVSYPDDRRAQNQLQACENIQQFNTGKKLYISNLPFNTDGYDFGAYIKDSFIYFTSTGGKSKDLKAKDINLWTGERFMDLYTVGILQSDTTSDEYTKAEKLAASVNTKYNEGPLCFDNANSKVYFTRNHYNPEDKVRMTYSKEKEANLNIYEADIENGKWKNIKELPFDSKEYSCGHPAWDAESSTLYFSSTMPGGFGGADLWKAKLTGNKWEKPVNMGAKFNTEGDEMFPTFDSDKIFYFSSDGLGGIGGLDVFSANIFDDGNVVIKNLGTPINSSYDDFGYLINQNKTVGYFSSNRAGGKGEDDIYRFADIKYELEIKVVNKFTNMPIEGALISVKQNENVIADLTSNQDGVSKTKVEPDLLYVLKADASSYLPATVSKKIENNEKKPLQKVTIELQPMVMQVMIINSVTKSPIPNALLTCNSPCNSAPKSNSTDASGKINYSIKDKCTYTLQASAKSYLPKPATQITTTLKDTIFVVIELEQISDKAITLNNIYYDFDKWDIRPEAEPDLKMLLAFMNNNPDAIVELSSHTDARGEDKYNLTLSQKRAQSAVNWLVAHGVNQNKIKPVGYGETKPVNNCTNNVKCTEEQHQKNRRTEFRVLNAGEIINSKVKEEILVDPCKNCLF